MSQLLHEHVTMERPWTRLYIYKNGQGNIIQSERCHQAAVCVQGPSRQACIGGGITTPWYLTTPLCSVGRLMCFWPVTPATHVLWEVRREGAWDTDRFAESCRSQPSLYSGPSHKFAVLRLESLPFLFVQRFRLLGKPL